MILTPPTPPSRRGGWPSAIRRCLTAGGILGFLGWIGSVAVGNAAPSWPAMDGRKVVPVGFEGSIDLAATAPASSTPSRTHSLTYSLLRAPDGATLDPRTGVLRWKPTTAQAGSSNVIQVVAEDAASPSSRTTNAFPVFVPPLRPNVVILVTDDHGFGDISAHGGPAATPNIDRLGVEGIRLERFYATPVCSVTRATLLTGRNPIRTQVNNTRGLDLGEHTLPETFRAAGYQTFLCGKWHLGGLYNVATNTVINGVVQPVLRENVEYQPQNRGWDVHYGEYTGAINYSTQVSQENGQPDWWLNGQPLRETGWSTDLLADKAVQLIRQRDPSRPIVLYLAFNAVHGPVSAPPEYLSKYAGIADVKRRTLVAAVDHMDVAIGRVLAAIDAEGMRTNTLVAFFGDNGGQASTGGSNLPLRGDKGDLYDGGIHTPAAIRWPGVLPSGVTNCQQFTWVGDLFPTLCAATGVTPLNVKPFDGVNLWPALLAADNRPFADAFRRPTPLVSGSSAGSAILDVFDVGDGPTMYKLLRAKRSGAAGGGLANLGLFDILRDPLETRDLLASPALAGVAASLAAAHDALRPEAYSPYVSIQPQDQSARPGDTVTLWAIATAYTKQSSCQWRRNGVNLPGATSWTSVDTSAFLARLDLRNVSEADAASYDVVVTDAAVGWPTSVASRPARLMINGGGTANTAPVLAPIADRTATAGQPFLLDCPATDADVPPQSLRFTLATAPAGARIDAATGRIEWIPSADQALATHAFAVVVTDDGTPALSASRTFQVTVTTAAAPPPFDVLLGRPTDTSITASLLSTEPVTAYLEFGERPGEYLRRTPAVTLAAGEPALVAMSQLAPDRRHYYRTRHASTADGPFVAGPERTFHTRRARGSTFTFEIEADPHNRDNEPPVWRLALANMLEDQPDFLIDLGDTFMEEKVGLTNAYYLTRAGIDELHREVRTGFFSLLGHSVPTFLVNGNHEAEVGWILRLMAVTNNPAIWGAEARRRYFPVPVPGGFYTGSTNRDPYTAGPRDGYYAFEWGDALFVALDPFWYTSPKPQQDGWSWTLGAEQHAWLQRTLERSTARFKFVFAHHLIGGGLGNQARGGLTHAPYFEWGGRNADGTPGFASHRPGWSAPIQDLLLTNGVQAFFHGHDHLYVREVLDTDADGVPELVYQEVPQPSRTLAGTNSATGYGYTNGLVIGNSGHLRVTVSPTNAHVEYVRVFLPENEGPGRTNRMVSHAYDLAPVDRWTLRALPDTGQTNRHDAPVPGVDADHVGLPPSYTDNGDGTVTDDVTGLRWQRTDSGEMTWEAAVHHAATNTLGGVPPGTWRLPSIHELASLLVYYRENPALDVARFGAPAGTRPDYWWSRDRLATDPSRAWAANAGGGVGPKPMTETTSAGGTLRYHVRLVQGPPPPTRSPLHRLVDSGDGTVTDLDTGLMWVQGEAATLSSWTDALRHAEGLEWAGYSDWRLPDIRELESLNDETRTDPSIDTAAFPGAKAARYWSSTTQNNRPSHAWFNEFITGITSQAPKDELAWVRPVRGPGTTRPPVVGLGEPIATNVTPSVLKVQGDAGRLYTLQASTGLNEWWDLASTNPPVTPFLWTPPSAADPARFYRVRVEP